MVGKYTIQLSTKRVSFKLDIKRKYTVIRGDSATGKSTLANYILQYNLQGTDSGIYLKCDIPVRRFIDEDSLKHWNDCIVVVDEGDTILRSSAIASIFKESECYFIIITRQKLGYLPYSLHEIYEFESRTIQPKYTETSLCKKHHLKLEKTKPDVILTEDSGSGYTFFKESIDIVCDFAGGKTLIKNKLEELIKIYKSVLVICDGAAIGSEVEDLETYIQLIQGECNINIYAPESFEWLILRGLYYGKDVKRYLDYTYDYCDTKKYDSWEQYYTAILKDLGNNFHKPYSKKNMDKYYYDNAEKILALIPNIKVEYNSVTDYFED